MKDIKTEASVDLSKVEFGAKRLFFDHGHTRSAGFRKSKLKALAEGIKTHEPFIYEALLSDLGKGQAESYITEISLIQEEIKLALSHLDDWMKVERRPTPIVLHPSSSHVVHEPKGVVLIIAPWNYPLLLALVPLVSAIAAGNCAVIKPSEEAPAAAAVIERLLSDVFSSDYVSVVQGLGHEVVPSMLRTFTFNHIFFTGSPAVGSLIAREAAAKLSPITLELGGKSPGIVDKDANLKVAARRLVFGKFTNAGQTCVAPDYLLLHFSIKDAFIAEARKALVEFYGQDPSQSADYGRMVNAKRFHAVSAFLADGETVHGGQSNASELYIAPTILDEVALDSAVMGEEIFGPVWPVITWSERNEILEITRRMRYPLACYVFTQSKSLEKFVLENVEFGGGCVNNAVVQFANHDLPFGGIQGSGSGNYHGWHGFATFSHTKSIMRTATWLDPKLKYPPFGKFKLKWIKKLLG
jgi:aldehyde dehydrogenase (NAD+)